MSGIGDERTRSLYRDACAFAGSVMSFVLPGWWLVTVAKGDPNDDARAPVRGLRRRVGRRGDRAAAPVVAAQASRRRSSAIVCAGSSNTSPHV